MPGTYTDLRPGSGVAPSGSELWRQPKMGWRRGRGRKRMGNMATQTEAIGVTAGATAAAAAHPGAVKTRPARHLGKAVR